MHNNSKNSLREERVSALSYNYAAQEKNAVKFCNLCASSRFTVISHRDRYGYPATASMCNRCGLTVLDPVMTSSAYATFYTSIYRPLVSAYHGRLINAQTIQDEQRIYASQRGDFLAPFFAEYAPSTLLDIGGSTGVVAHSLAKRFGIDATIIDPAPLEIEQAQKLGLKTITALLEDFEPKGEQYDVIAMFQTVDHLLDVNCALTKIKSLLKPAGFFFVDIVDFRAAYLRNWSIEEAIKIDHPFYLTEHTMRAFLSISGFEVLRTDYAEDHLHISFLCKPCDPKQELPSPCSVAGQIEEIRRVQNTPLWR